LGSAQSELNKTVAAVATARWAVFIGVKSSVEVDRPQAGGYNICEIALEPFLYLEIPEAAFDGGKRFVVVVLKRAGHKWGIGIKHVLHSKRECYAIEPGAPSTRVILSS